MKNFGILISLFAFICAAACLNQKIPYRKLDQHWQIKGDRFLDSAQFYNSDTLFFLNDPERHLQGHDVNTLTFDKSGHTFSCSIRNHGMHGYYSLNRSAKLLILTDCETPTEDEKTWIKKKSDTFAIVRLSEAELVLTQKK